jgi:16S rRNA (cytidine1402-2'-O)-methyltransferase
MEKPEPGLYVVATPIGHLDDLSPRARAVLSGVDLICAEDTRKTTSLLAALQIPRPRLGLLAVHAHNERGQVDQILERLEAGCSVALVSDAGTPGISDPGARLVDEAWAQGHRVTPLPGPSALTAALSVSGFWSQEDQPVTFWGFLPSKPQARRQRLEAIGQRRGLAVVFESPHRIAACLVDAVEVLGADCQALVGRELSKSYETLLRGSLEQLIEQRAEGLGRDPQSGQGEHVLVFNIQPNEALLQTSPLGLSDWASLLKANCPPTLAARLLSKGFGLDRQASYDLLEALGPGRRAKSTK